MPTIISFQFHGFSYGQSHDFWPLHVRQPLGWKVCFYGQILFLMFNFDHFDIIVAFFSLDTQKTDKQVEIMKCVSQLIHKWLFQVAPVNNTQKCSFH